MTSETHMRREILEIPAAVDTLLTQGEPAIRVAATALAERDPAFLVTVARGSSDHAATYLKYCCELLAGVPVASLGPSVASIYGGVLRMDRGACVAISQSGASPDIVAMARMAGASGAPAVAITNDPGSALAQTCGLVLPMHAGPERSVAATKTFVCSLVASVWLLAVWRENEELLSAISDLPAALQSAVQQDWGVLSEEVARSASLFCLGRGPSLAMSNEAALKLKETCQLHAESYSSAEVLHGPVSIVAPGFPVIALAVEDKAEAGLVQVADALADKGARVFATSDKAQAAQSLPYARTGHPLTDPISVIVSFYAMVEQAARARGINPDEPPHLRKVTETL